jgi:hypothetical protein
VVRHRRRGRKLCACGACSAQQAGPSTSPLERMRIVALVLLGVVTASVGAAEDGSDRWAEYSHLYATVANVNDMGIIVRVDAALASLGFHRDLAGGTYLGNRVRGGIFVSYKTDGLAAALIVPGSRPGCIVFSATNYDEHVAGLAKAATAAIEATFKKSFGSSLILFSDATCSHALSQSLEGSVMRGLFGAAGAWGQCAPAAPVRRGRAAPQLHR